LLDSGLDHQACVTALIASGVAAIGPEDRDGQSAATAHDQLAELTRAGRL